MDTMLIILIVLGVILFFFLNLAAREMSRKLQEMKRQTEREEALDESLRRDFSRESKTLTRVEVRDPKARILCVDDEAVILDSFRKILALDGYSVDTVETGKEALGLIQMRDYDFVFTDLKMPEMSGTEVVKSVRHMRPDIDVVIITGFATVESAVECMKHGAMDYLEKPYSESELRTFVRQALIRREDGISKQVKPRVHVMSPAEIEQGFGEEFSIPGGLLISTGHCWVSLADDGTAKVGLDDFARKLLGTVDSIEFPNIGLSVKAGQPLFSVNQRHRRAHFNAPISGQVVRINEELQRNCAGLEASSYGRNWICVIEGSDLDEELTRLNVGKSAISFFQEDIDRFQNLAKRTNDQGISEPAPLSVGAIENLDDHRWEKTITEFFGR